VAQQLGPADRGIILEQALWLSALGAGLALDHAMVGQFMLAQPLVVGTIFGMLLGDLPAGLLVGAMVQLLWIGVLPVGAYVPSDHTVTGGITAGLTIMLIQQQNLPLAPSMILALSLAIPAGVLSGKLDILVRHLNSRIAGMGEQVAEKYGTTGIDGLNLSGLITTFLRNFIIYFVWLGPIAILVSLLALYLPQPVIRGMEVVFWVLPMLSFAVILEIIAKERSRWLAAGIFIMTWILMMVWPNHALLVFGGILGLGAIIMWRRRV